MTTKDNKAILDIISNKEVVIEKCSNEVIFDLQEQANVLEMKREPSLLNSYQEILSEINFLLEDDEEKALSQLSIERAEKVIDTLSSKIAEKITLEIINDADNETNNPLIMQETNKSRENMMRDISGALSPRELSEKYPFIKSFDYNEFTADSLSLEEEKMLDFYYMKCSELLNKKNNAQILQEFSRDMLSDEFEIFLEDIARF